MRILGVDPGLTRCGVSVLSVSRSRRYTVDHVEVLRTRTDDVPAVRLMNLEVLVEEVVNQFQPDVLSLERVFSQLNVRTVMGTAQASAVVMLCAARHKMPVFLYTPTEVKAAVTGYGRADKSQVTTMVTRILNLPQPPKPADAADALALALCHGMKGLNSGLIAQKLSVS